MKAILCLGLFILLMVNTASAGSTITVDPVSIQEIEVGDSQDYTITLTTTETSGRIIYETTDSLLFASLDSASDPDVTTTMDDYGYIDLSSISSPQTFTLTVSPQSGITLEQIYDIEIEFRDANRRAKAMATASSFPVPELATIGLISLGLIGLVGLVRRQRKE